MNVHCTYKEMLPPSRLSIEMTKVLKVRTNNSLDGEVRRLLEHGFLTPIFVWKNGETNEVIDGVGRKMAVDKINSYLLGIGKEGEIREGIGSKIEAVPVVYIEAETIDEAKKKVILANSMFGKINKDILDQYSESSGEAADFIKCHQSFFEVTDFPDVTLPETPNIDLDELLNTGAYSPIIDTDFIDSEDIERAGNKIKNVAKREPKQTREITCKHCGHTFTVGK